MTRITRVTAVFTSVIVAALSLAAPPRASSPVTWDYPDRPGAAALTGAAVPGPRGIGKAEGITVADDGRLGLSPPLREIFPAGSDITPPPVVWTVAPDPAGGLYVGTGNAGRVIRIDRKGEASPFFDADEIGVRALAVNVRGDLFLGTFPNGAVYRLSAGKDPVLWFDPEERYLWTMTVDSADRLYLATGERGVLYRVHDRASGGALLDTDGAHITALASDRTGRILAGTDPDGLLYRVAQEGPAEVLLDSDLREISAIALAPDGAIYAAAISDEEIRPSRKAGDKDDLTIEVTPAPDGSVLEEQTETPRKIRIDLADLLPPREGAAEGAAGRIYRIEERRSPALVWKSDTERVYALAWVPQQGLLFGTGGVDVEAGLYRLAGDGSAALLHRLREPQITSIAAAPDGRAYVGTGNPGRVYLIEPGTAPSGSYHSPIFDAGRSARWGAIAWDADAPPGTRVEISTRSGNRADPDESWSGWSPGYATPAGSRIVSPAGRYLQWRAQMSLLRSETMPALRAVRVTLLPGNREPEVASVSVLPRGERAPSAAATEAKGKGPGPAPPDGRRWVLWDSRDPDGDDLTFSVSLRPAGEENFRPLAEAASSPWALDDSGLAEGAYYLRIEASDLPTNGSERALVRAGASPRFLVDRTPPKIEAQRSSGAPDGRLVIEATATDALGPIARAERAVTGGEGEPSFMPLPCRDGICDTSTESFLIDVADPGNGRSITIRVFDSAGNAATAEVSAAGRRGNR